MRNQFIMISILNNLITGPGAFSAFCNKTGKRPAICLCSIGGFAYGVGTEDYQSRTPGWEGKGTKPLRDAPPVAAGVRRDHRP